MTVANWNLSPLLILSLVAWSALYLIRFRKVAASEPRAAGPAQIAAAATALVLLAVALLSPIDGLAERSFTLHMVQHLILADLAPLLILLALTRVILRPLTKRFIHLEKILGPFSHPIVALTVWLMTIYLWHLPALYDATLQNPFLHVLEHVTFLTAGLIFWWPLVQPIPLRHQLDGATPIAYITAAKLGLGLLGLYLVWLPTPLFNAYQNVDNALGLSEKSDQTVGGMLMMLEQSLVLAVAFTIFFVKMLARSERDQLRRESASAADYSLDR